MGANSVNVDKPSILGCEKEREREREFHEQVSNEEFVVVEEPARVDCLSLGIQFEIHPAVPSTRNKTLSSLSNGSRRRLRFHQLLHFLPDHLLIRPTSEQHDATTTCSHSRSENSHSLSHSHTHTHTHTHTRKTCKEARMKTWNTNITLLSLRLSISRNHNQQWYGLTSHFSWEWITTSLPLSPLANRPNTFLGWRNGMYRPLGLASGGSVSSSQVWPQSTWKTQTPFKWPIKTHNGRQRKRTDWLENLETRLREARSSSVGLSETIKHCGPI